MNFVKAILVLSLMFIGSEVFARGFSSRDLATCSASIELPAAAQTQVLGQISTSVLMEYAWPCARGILMGAWEATGGLLVSAGRCVWSPIQCARKARQAMSNAYDFFTNITERVTQAMSALASLPASAIAEIICGIIGGIGAGVIVGILTGGANAPMLARTLAAVTSRLQKLATLARTVSRIPLKILARLSRSDMDKVERAIAFGHESRLARALGACQ